MLASLDVGPGDRVAVIAHNRAEWLDIMVGCFKRNALFVNVNYRYTAAEVAYVLRDSGSALVVAEQEFEPVVTAAIAEAGVTPHVLYLDRDDSAKPATAAAWRRHRRRATTRRASGRVSTCHTGGTTGSPKGVVWTQENLVNGAIAYGWARHGAGIGFTDPDTVVKMLSENVPVVMAVAPMMHGNGQWAVLRGWVLGGTSAVWTGRRYNAENLLNALEKLGVNIVTLVGDAMGRPIAAALEANPRGWDLSKLAAVGPAGGDVGIDEGGVAQAPAAHRDHRRIRGIGVRGRRSPTSVPTTARSRSSPFPTVSRSSMTTSARYRVVRRAWWPSEVRSVTGTGMTRRSRRQRFVPTPPESDGSSAATGTAQRR